jgi:hypothetical protein
VGLHQCPSERKGEGVPVRRLHVPSHVPGHTQTAAKVRGFSPTAAGCIAEIDSPLEGGGFEPSVPLWRMAPGPASAELGEGPEMADRLRGSHQRGQTTAWTQSQPVQGGCRYQALGRPRGDCRQPGQHQPRHGQSVRPLIPIPLTSQLVGGDLPAGPRAQIRCTVGRKRLFAPESS